MIDVVRRQVADVLRFVADRVDQPRPIVVSVHLDGSPLTDAVGATRADLERVRRRQRARPRPPRHSS